MKHVWVVKQGICYQGPGHIIFMTKTKKIAERLCRSDGFKRGGHRNAIPKGLFYLERDTGNDWFRSLHRHRIREDTSSSLSL